MKLALDNVQSLHIIMDSALFEALARGAEADCFLVGLQTVKRINLEGGGRDACCVTLGRQGAYRHVPVIPVPHMRPDGMELILRPFVGTAEIRVLL